MSSSSLWFGVILLLRAILAQSAPNGIYPDVADEDEEALLDKLATYVAMGGGRSDNELLSRSRLPIMDDDRDDFDLEKPVYSDFDLPPLDYLTNTASNSLGNVASQQLSAAGLESQSIQNLPRQFAYKPNDIRFFIPPEDFPNLASNSNFAKNNLNTYASSSPSKFKSDDRSKVNEVLKSSPMDTMKVLAASDDRDRMPPHMKKSRDDVDDKDEAGVFEPAVQPGNILSSAQGADKPGGPFVTSLNDGQSPYSIYYIALIAGLSSAGVVGIVGAGICWYRVHERIKATAEVDYPAYGVTGPDVSPTGGDRKLAQSAHMYHYQHQKQQMAALQKSTMEGGGGGNGGDEKAGGSDVESEDDNEDGDYTVYECPGLAPAGDMEVKNPLFDDEPTPATPSALPTEIASKAKE